MLRQVAWYGGGTEDPGRLREAPAATARHRDGRNWASPTITVQLATDTVNLTWTTLGTFQTALQTGDTYSAPQCVREIANIDYGYGTRPPILVGYECFVEDSVLMQRVENELNMSYSPAGERIIVAVSRDVLRVVATSGFHLCRDSRVVDGIDVQRCVTFSYENRTETTELWSIAIPSGAVTPPADAPSGVE
jgi:hypothetical protein